MAASLERRTSSSSPSATSLLLISTTIATSSSSTSPTEITSSKSNTETISSPPYILPELIPLVASRLTALQDFCALRSRLLHFCLPRNRLADIFGRLPTFYSFGCRVAIHDRKDGGSIRIRHILHVRHLLTGEQARLPDPTKEFHGLVFSSDIILIISLDQRVLYYCRIGDTHWQKAKCDEVYQLYNVISVKDTLYALVLPHYRLAVIELRDNSVKLSFLGEELSTPKIQRSTVLRLAECSGELLLVIAAEGSPLVYHVFRWQTAERKWARTASLGGCSLFFNRYQFAGCLSSDHPTARRDCLYFIWCSSKWSEYSLVDGSWHQHVVNYPGKPPRNHFGAMTWVLPSIG